MLVERGLERGDHCGEVLLGGAEAFVGLGEVGEEAAGAAFHDGEQDAVLGAEVVVDGADRDAGFLDDRVDRRAGVALLGHDALGGVEHDLA